MKIVIDVLEDFMKRIASFLDKHRVLLVFLILALVVIIYLGVNSYLFFHHDFLKLECTEEIDEEYCYHDDIEILKDPEKSKEAFFLQYEDLILDLREELKSIEVGLFVHHIQTYKEKLEQLLQDEEIIASQKEQEDSKMEGLQTAKESLRKVVDDITNQIEEMQNLGFESTNKIEKINSEIGITKERIQNNKNNQKTVYFSKGLYSVTGNSNDLQLTIYLHSG